MIEFPKNPPITCFNHLIRSRYSETDKMGYVYYGRYLEYFEVARTEMIRSLGISYRRLEDDGVMLPVIYSQVVYKSPVFYDEEMRIETTIYEQPSVRLKTYYRVFTEKQKNPHVSGQVNLCFTDAVTRKPVKAPPYFLEMMQVTP